MAKGQVLVRHVEDERSACASKGDDKCSVVQQMYGNMHDMPCMCRMSLWLMQNQRTSRICWVERYSKRCTSGW